MAQSESLKNLIPALISARKSFKPLEKGRENPYFKSKYASLDDVLAATDEALAANGLVVIQATEGPLLRSVLSHASGEWIDGAYPLAPAKANDPQALGAAVTYARRYALQAILGICADEDDDGNRASQKASGTRPALTPVPTSPIASQPPQMPDFDVPDDAGYSDGREPGLDSDLVKVVSVKEKSGTSKAGKPYAMFTVEFSDHKKATTFDRTVAAEAQIAANNKLDVAVALEEGRDFAKWKTYELRSLQIVAGPKNA